MLWVFEYQLKSTQSPRTFCVTHYLAACPVCGNHSINYGCYPRHVLLPGDNFLTYHTYLVPRFHCHSCGSTQLILPGCIFPSKQYATSVFAQVWESTQYDTTSHTLDLVRDQRTADHMCRWVEGFLRTFKRRCGTVSTILPSVGTNWLEEMLSFFYQPTRACQIQKHTVTWHYLNHTEGKKHAEY